MNFTIVTMPAMTVIGNELRTTFKNNQSSLDIPAFWHNIREKNNIAHIPQKTEPRVLIGLYTNYSPDFSLTTGHYSLIVGTQVNSSAIIPEGMVAKSIPVSKYAVFKAQGPFATALGHTWMEIWKNKKIQRTFTNDFEWYDIHSTNDENSIVNIYIAIK